MDSLNHLSRQELGGKNLYKQEGGYLYENLKPKWML